MGQNLVEKITQKHTVNILKDVKVHSGDFIYIQPAYVMTHDNTGAVIPKFKSIGAEKLHNPRQVVHTLDHNIQDTGEKNLAKYKKIEQFSNEMGADFYPAGRGIGHQIMCEEGYAFPGTLVVASDSHSNMYGGLGCLGTPIVRTDAAAVWATGRTWWQIPPVAKVVLKGKLCNGVTGKDVIVALCGRFNNDEVLNHAVEFTGDGVNSLSVDQRLTIANMTTEWGALAGVFPIDSVTIEWLKNRADYISKRGLAGVNSDADGNGIHPRLNHNTISKLEENMIDFLPDPDAFYSKTLTVDLSTVQPYVSGPNSVKIMNSAYELSQQDIKVNKAYLVSCVNSRLEDIKEAAEVIEGKKVADGVEFYIAAASSEVQMESEKLGYWKKLTDAGAIELPPGCGPCIGLGAGLLEDGEVGISATNRNFKGRMGSKNALAYLASPAVVAYSAVTGKISSHYEKGSMPLSAEIMIHSKVKQQKQSAETVDGFPSKITGEVIYCHADNMNTDGIYPGKYTYMDDFKPEDQAKVVMENYDPEFKNIAKEGDILVGGFNFGTGSSREQAATALKYKGIKLVIAGSFNDTYMRNAINNGYLLLSVPDMVIHLKNKFGTDKLTVRTEMNAIINFNESVINCAGEEFTFQPLGTAAQELIVSGGLENWVSQRI